MTWTYDPSLSTSLAVVRFEIQDTEITDQLFSDEEINATLTSNASGIPQTVLVLVKKLMIRFARLVDTTVGRVSEANNQRYQAYKDLAYRLEAQTLCLPSFGGTEVVKNEALDADTSLEQPQTRVGDTDNVRNVSTFGGGGGQ